MFRAKAINRVKGREYRTKYKNGDWVYGLISRPYKEMFPTLPMEFRNENGVSGIEVDYKTVGQYVGICDRNGKKVYVGDIIKVYYCKNEYVGRVVFNEKTCGFEFWYNTIVGAYGEKATHKMNFAQFSEFEVIGNIHDNPELLDKTE